MKKNYFKKSLSLVLTALMLMSCWVFIAPTEVDAAVTADQLKAANEAKIKDLTGSTTINTTSGVYFKGDSDAGITSVPDVYQNLLWSGSAQQAAIITNQTIQDSNDVQQFAVYYPATVLMYDGSTTPQMGVSILKDSLDKSDSKYQVFHYGTKISSTTDLVIPGDWHTKNEETGSSNPKFYYTWNGGNNQAGLNYTGTKGNSYYAGGVGWHYISNLIQFKGTFSDTTYSATYTPTFQTYLGRQWKQLFSNKSKEATYTLSCSVPIYVINAKALKAAYDEINSFKKLITDNPAKYTSESVAEFVQYANALTATNPNTYTWSSNTATQVSNYASNVKTALTNWKNWAGLKEVVTITWKNYDGTAISTEVIAKGSTPAWSGTNPTRPANNTTVFTFKGWDPAFAPVEKNQEYIAQYSEADRYYTINFIDYDGTSLSGSGQYLYEATVNAPVGLTRTGYRFTGWSPELAKVTKDQNYTAQYIQTFIVTFVNADGTVMSSVTVDKGGSVTYSGATPSLENTQEYEYEFTGWDKEATNVTSNVTVTALYEQKSHTIDYRPENDAGCTSPGTFYKYCTTCSVNWGIVENEELAPALGHNFKVVKNTSDGNADGYHTVICKLCEIEEQQKHTYDFNNPSGDPFVATCSKPGESYYKCECGQIKTIVGKIDPDNHVNTVEQGAVAPQCGVPGKEADIYCNDCKTVVKEGAAIPALKHDYTGAIKNNGNGTHSYLCKNNCGTYGGTVYCSNWVEDGDNCKCEDCGYTKEHAYDGWVQDSANTASAPGKMSHTCVDCDKVETVDCTNYVEIDRTAEDCDNAEVITYECSDCGHVYSVEGKPATGHDYTGAIKNEGNGTHSYLCKNNCGTYGGTVKCSNWKEDGNNCKCGDCGYTKAHNWGEGWKPDSNQMSAEGRMTRVCLDCGKTENEACRYEEVAGSHKDATCTTPEMTSYECSDCADGEAGKALPQRQFFHAGHWGRHLPCLRSERGVPHAGQGGGRRHVHHQEFL